MGALYEDVEKFFGDIFAKYGRFLARYPLAFILLSIITSSLLGMGLVTLRYEKQVSRLYTPMDSKAFADQKALAQLFQEKNRDLFFYEQQVYEGTYGVVIVVPSDPESPNVLQPAIIDEIWQLYEAIVMVESEDKGFRYAELCARRSNSCVVDGLHMATALHIDSCLSSNISHHYPDGMDYWVNINDVLGQISADNHCLTAKSFKLRFNLAHNHGVARDHSLSWEREFIKTLSKYSSTIVNITYATSGSLDIELADDLASDTKFFSLTILIMVVYASFVASGGDWVSTRMLLAQAGVFAALLSILASFGLLCMCGLEFVDICGVMPFLVLGLGLDDMFILMAGWRHTNVKNTIEERIAETFRSSAISVTITSLTDLLAFCIGATSPFLSVKNFCIFAGVAVFFCYINQLTFFGGCLVYHARRVADARHCLTCRKVKSRDAMEEEQRIYDRAEVICCSGQPPTERGQEDSVCEKIPSSILPRLLLQAPAKFFIIVLFIVYIGLSIWGASELKIGIKMNHLVPHSSYYWSYLENQRVYYPDKGASVMFCITEPVSYHEPNVHQKLQKFLLKVANKNYIYTRPSQRDKSWLEAFTNYTEHLQIPVSSEGDFVRVLNDMFLPDHVQYVNDVVFNDDLTRIQASRFHLTLKSYNDSTLEANLMTDIRELASNSTLPITVYSPQFVYFEHTVAILKNTLLAVGVAIIGMLFIALMFIPHPISITCVTITMVTIVLGMFGCMHFWGLELSAVTKVQIILSVGFCVDFTVHISHAFMTATGKNRNERVMSALEKVGIPILNGAMTSILGILMLGFANSYVFKSFFKTMLLVILLGIGHSLLLLPVVLSFIGPRRTAKPVFVPVHSSARVLMHQSSPVIGNRQQDSEHCSSPSTKEEDFSDSDPLPGGSRDEIELIKLDHDLGSRPNRKILSPVQEQNSTFEFDLHEHFRNRVRAQDSMDSESFQSLDPMS